MEGQEEQIQEQEQVVDQSQSTALQDMAFGDDTPPAVIETPEQPKVEEKVDEEVIAPTDWLEREFQIKDPEVLRQQLKEYNEFKSKPKEEIKFADEQSKIVFDYLREGKKDEVRKFLDTQDKLDRLTKTEVNDDTASDIIKMGMALKYKDLTQQQIDYKFNKQFSFPKEPTLDVDDDDSVERHNEWKQQVADIKMDKLIEAQLMKPELEKTKSELVLPEIQRESAAPKPSQEDLDAFNKAKETFLQSAEPVINSFKGFEVQVKDKDVDYTVSYAPSQEEKTLINGMVKTFAESGLDANVLFAERWLSDDGKNINVNQLVKDLSRIYGDDKITQKMVTDSGNKRIEAYLKEKKQIDVTQQNQNGNFNPSNAANALDEVREQAFA